jgi:hypothetical protein
MHSSRHRTYSRLVAGGVRIGSGRCSAGWPAAMLLAVVVHATLAAFTLAQTDEDGGKVHQLDAPPTVIRVPAGSTQEIKQGLTISIPERLRSLFPAENPVIWSPDAVQEPLRPVTFGETDAARRRAIDGRLPPVTLGAYSDPSAQVGISFERQPLNRPRRLWLHIREPGKLTVGAYEGKIGFRVETFNPPGLVERFVWPVRLYVEGRRIVEVRFSDLDPAVPAAGLAVGRSASVTARLMTVGKDFDLGSGRLRLLWKAAAAGSAAAETVLCVPMPLPAAPTDLSLDLPSMKTPLCETPVAPSGQWQTEWQGEALHGPAPIRLYDAATDGVRVALNEVQARLPDAVTTGTLQARVHWQRGLDSGGDDILEAETGPVNVAAGIRVAPQHAARAEPTLIQVVAGSDLGDEVPLAISDAAGQSVEIIGAVKTTGDKAATNGPCVKYEAVWLPPALGQYQVRLAANADEAQVKAIGNASALLRVDLSRRQRLNEPVTVFVDSPPVGWNLCFEPSGSTCLRKAALMICADDSLRLKEVALKGVYRIDSSGARLPCELRGQGGEPTIEFVAANSGEGEDKRGNVWPAVENGVALDLKVSTDEASQNILTDGLARRQYVMRFHVAGTTGDGSPAFRVIDVPVEVTVAASWVYYRKAMIWALVILGPLLALLIVWWIWSRAFGPKAGHVKKERILSHEAGEAREALAPDPADVLSPTPKAKTAADAKASQDAAEAAPAADAKPPAAPAGPKYIGVTPD